MTEPEFGDECERCDADSRSALRSIKMRGGIRELLCEDCFVAAFQDDEVHPSDPRVPASEYRLRAGDSR